MPRRSSVQPPTALNVVCVVVPIWTASPSPGIRILGSWVIAVSLLGVVVGTAVGGGLEPGQVPLTGVGEQGHEGLAGVLGPARQHPAGVRGRTAGHADQQSGGA